MQFLSNSQKKILVSSLVFLCSSILTNAQNDFLGKWLAQDKDGIVEIYQNGEKYHGKVVKLIPETDENGQPFLDAKNPDKKKRNTPLLGMLTFFDFKYEEGILKSGKLYDPKSGKTYRGKLWIEDGKLKVRGYLGFFYETQTWTRTNQ